MFLAQRLEKIRSILSTNKSIDISSLSEILGVSEVTVRKDLERLEDEGFLVKYHGGAMLKGQGETAAPFSQSISDLETPELAAKLEVAKLAASLVEDGDNLFIGSGSTCAVFARAVAACDLRVVTNSMDVAASLYQRAKSVFLLGGVLAQTGGFFYSSGDALLEFMKGVFVEKSFFSVDGIDWNAGFTVNEFSRVGLMRHLKAVSKSLVILSDYTKFDTVAIHQVGGLDFADCVVTNRQADGRYKELFFEKNIRFLAAFDF